jgi:exopolyphosphatase/guanosine-5'-triphosphate,3'-diphosphate pyrophosphatase
MSKTEGRAMIVAALDLGSNTLKLTIAEIGPRGEISILRERAEITRVGQGLDAGGLLREDAMERTFGGLEKLLAEAREAGAERMRCVATAALRSARNAAIFLERARNELGLEIEVIHGHREAELAFSGPARRYGDGPLLVVDVGGRSTEIVTGSSKGLAACASLEIGSVLLTERFLADDPPRPEQIERARRYVESVLAAAPAAPEGARLAGVSGTILSLMGLALELRDMDEAVRQGEGRPLTLTSVRRRLAMLAALPARERVSGTVLPPGRADVIVGGALVALLVMERYGASAMIVSNLGVRFGLLLEMALRH